MCTAVVERARIGGVANLADHPEKSHTLQMARLGHWNFKQSKTTNESLQHGADELNMYRVN